MLGVRGRIRDGVARWLPTAWALGLALLMLGGGLGRGFILSYDMVWVPDLALGADALGLGSALPRAVPSDAVVAVLDEIVPGMLLQKLVLVAALAAAGAGAAAIVGTGTTARLVAATISVWNPFVVERLAIGHWPVLVGYGVLPWIVVAGAAWRRNGVLPARLPVLLVLGSLSASIGLMTAIAVCAAAASRTRRRATLLAVLIATANAPWVVSGLLHAGTATSSRVGADVFAPSGREGMLSAPLHFLSLGGVWNTQVVPPSRTGVLAVALTVVLVLLAALGARRGWALVPSGLGRPLLVCWTTGMVLVVLTWAFPAATGELAASVPGAGLLRDGSRMLALAAPLTTVLVGRGAHALAGFMPDAASRTMIGLACVLLPVTLMPDAALGLSGRLTAVDYPESYDALVRELRSLPHGDVAVLPFQSYRAPSWNDGGRPVYVPLGRYLNRRTVVEDQLVVNGRPIAGEDPRAGSVRDALFAPTPDARGAGLRDAGIRLVVVEALPGVVVPEVAGEPVWQDDLLRVVDLGPGAPSPSLSVVSAPSMGVAWVLWASAWLAGLVLALRRRRGAVPTDD